MQETIEFLKQERQIMIGEFNNEKQNITQHYARFIPGQQLFDTNILVEISNHLKSINLIIARAEKKQQEKNNSKPEQSEEVKTENK